MMTWAGQQQTSGFPHRCVISFHCFITLFCLSFKTDSVDPLSLSVLLWYICFAVSFFFTHLVPTWISSKGSYYHIQWIFLHSFVIEPAFHTCPLLFLFQIMPTSISSPRCHNFTHYNFFFRLINFRAFDFIKPAFYTGPLLFLLQKVIVDKAEPQASSIYYYYHFLIWAQLGYRGYLLWVTGVCLSIGPIRGFLSFHYINQMTAYFTIQCSA